MTLETNDLHRHLSGQFNADLTALHRDLLDMGQLVSLQLRDAVRALERDDAVLARRVVDRDPDVNALELRLDEECRDVLVRRQPAAGDLRLVFAVLKAVIDLERMGDQAKRVASTSLEASGQPQQRFGTTIGHLGSLVLGLVDKALDAFSRLDVRAALEVRKDDRAVDGECRAITRQLLTYMMEDPRTISAALNLVWAARALERIGDHAKNIAEYVIYAVHGKDLRHMSDEERARWLPSEPH